MKDWSDIGAQLRAAREATGASHEDVSHHTRIPARTLRKLEENDDEHLPDAAYTRSFLAQYAEFLELDADDWLQHLEFEDTFANLDQHGYLQESSEVFGEPIAKTTAKPRTRHPRKPVAADPPANHLPPAVLQPLMVFSLTAVLIAAGIYSFLRISDQIEQASFNNARKDLADSPILSPLPSVVPSRPARPKRAKSLNSPAPAVAEVVSERSDDDIQPQLVIDGPPPRAIVIEE